MQSLTFLSYESFSLTDYSQKLSLNFLCSALHSCREENATGKKHLGSAGLVLTVGITSSNSLQVIQLLENWTQTQGCTVMSHWIILTWNITVLSIYSALICYLTVCLPLCWCSTHLNWFSLWIYLNFYCWVRKMKAYVTHFSDFTNLNSSCVFFPIYPAWLYV